MKIKIIIVSTVFLAMLMASANSFARLDAVGFQGGTFLGMARTSPDRDITIKPAFSLGIFSRPRKTIFGLDSGFRS